MPTYEYRCLTCGHQYEKREGYHAPPFQKCPKCRNTTRRVLHAAPIVFKGSGFYITDNRKAAPETESESKAESTKTGEDSAGKDAEPAAAG